MGLCDCGNTGRVYLPNSHSDDCFYFRNFQTEFFRQYGLIGSKWMLFYAGENHRVVIKAVNTAHLTITFSSFQVKGVIGRLFRRGNIYSINNMEKGVVEFLSASLFLDF